MGWDLRGREEDDSSKVCLAYLVVYFFRVAWILVSLCFCVSSILLMFSIMYLIFVHSPSVFISLTCVNCL